jgi:hemolysin III
MGNWNCHRVKNTADRVFQAIGVCFWLIGAVIIVALVATHSTQTVVIAATLPYAVVLAAMLWFSGRYNISPVSPTKWILRRFDHSAIYLLMAGTYTPFIAQLKTRVT